MSWLQGLIYGLVSGFTEFLPISSQAHQALLLQLFGLEQREPVCDLIVHIAILLSLYMSYKTVLDQLRRDRNLRQQNRKSYRSTVNIAESRFIRNAVIPMLIGSIVLYYTAANSNNLLIISAFLSINGILLYASNRVMQGNKDARAMAVFDSFLIGIAGAVSAISGISRTGSVASVAMIRGADRKKAYHWALLLSVPALYLLAGLDLFSIIANPGVVHFWSSIPGYLLSAIGAFCGGCCSVALLRFLILRNGLYGFAYYSWGASLFSFLLYLTVV